MDKNLKAELSALKIEVIGGLKGLEALMGKIDTKLAESEEEASLAKCPNLAELLKKCQDIKWDNSTPQYYINEFNSLVNKVQSLFEVTESQRFAEYTKSIIDLSKKLDVVMENNSPNSLHNRLHQEIKKNGKIDSTLISNILTENDKLSDLSIEIPNTETDVLPDGRKSYYVDVGNLSSEDAQHIVDELKNQINPMSQVDDFFIPVPGIDDTDPIENLKRLDDVIQASIEYRNNDKSKPRSPNWLTDIDRKKTSEILRDALTWDEYNQDLFQRQWNSHKELRMKLVREALNTVLSDIMNYDPNFRMNISSPEDAQKYLNAYENFNQAKTSVEMVLRRIDGDIISKIELNDDPLNFKKYYDWCVNADFKIRSLYIDDNSITSHFIRNTSNMFKTLIDKVEIDMFDQPYDFGKKLGMTEEQRQKVVEYSYKNYFKDLKNAYEYLNNKVSITDVEKANISFALSCGTKKEDDA